MYICLFKHLTAYEMRIGDWSSDVCSSDLPQHVERRVGEVQHAHHPEDQRQAGRDHEQQQAVDHAVEQRNDQGLHENVLISGSHAAAKPHDAWPRGARSEEHTSELQSLMRISYAVFCLKKKKATTKKKKV